MNIASLIEEQVKLNPHKKAIIFPEGEDSMGRMAYSHYTYEGFNVASNSLAEEFRGLGIKKGTRCLVFIKPSLDFPLIVFALFKLGAVPVFLDPGMGRKNLLACIKHVAATVLIGIPQVHYLSFLFRGSFKGVKLRIKNGGPSFCPVVSLASLLDPKRNELRSKSHFHSISSPSDDIAAVIFTSGGTGRPKGVVYTHGVFADQVNQLRQLFNYNESDSDMPAFPLFALTSMAMGVTSVIPDMDPSKPAQVDPAKLVRTILDQGITTAAGSPAIWERVGLYCKEKGIVLSKLRALIMFGAPVSPDLHELFSSILPAGTSYTPYGATECLPVSCISGKEVLEKTAGRTKQGEGTCVGFPVPGLELKIVKISHSWNEAFKELAPYEVGEVIVKGPQVTRTYLGLPEETKKAKIYDDDGTFWHRMGDLAYLDSEGLLWFCGRKAHEVQSPEGSYYPAQCEAVFNQHPDVKRSALVSLSSKQDYQPGIIIERTDHKKNLTTEQTAEFRQQLLTLGKEVHCTKTIKSFFLHENFPVDARHNIKIDRKKLRQSLHAGALGRGF